ncbi:unnamed protein product [Calypogeia fissa]
MKNIREGSQLDWSISRIRHSQLKRWWSLANMECPDARVKLWENFGFVVLHTLVGTGKHTKNSRKILAGLGILPLLEVSVSLN